jgi:hypothetical protein
MNDFVQVKTWQPAVWAVRQLSVTRKAPVMAFKGHMHGCDMLHMLHLPFACARRMAHAVHVWTCWIATFASIYELLKA